MIANYVNYLFGRGPRALVAATALLAAPAVLSAATPPRTDEPVFVSLSDRDVDASTREVLGAYGSLVAMWKGEFQAQGASFRAPRLLAYRDVAHSACGNLPAENALYCVRDNTIYFDEVFIAGQSAITGHALGTDGDMAGVGIIAHEMGHAVAYQAGQFSRDSYTNEATADCLAGAFARHSQEDGSLEKGDMEEAFYAMAQAADPELLPTGNARVDRRNARMLQRARHGTQEERQENFRRGLTGGSDACLE